MQIHEITLKSKVALDEGVAQNIRDMGTGLKTAASMAAAGVKDFAGRAASIAPSSDAFGTLGQVFAPGQEAQAQKQTSDYVNKLAGEWLAGPGKTTVQKVAPAAANTTPAVGMRFRVVNPSNQGTYFKTGNTWSTELGQPIVAPNTISYLEKLLDGGAGREEPTSTNNIKEAPEYTTPTGIVIPSGAKTAATAPTNTGSTYGNQLRDWAASKLKSTEPSTGNPITLDDVEANAGTKQQLTRLLIAINQSTGNPAELEKLVKNYLLTAVRGIQQRSAEIRATSTKSATTQRRASSSITNDALYKLGQEVIGRGEKVQNPTGSPTIDQMLQQAGLLK